MGIALLLFVVGLKLDLKMIRTMGPVALTTGMGQVFFTSVFGFVIALGLGMQLVHSVYVAVALTFSSTIIIVKLLSDKREIDSLHGRIAVGFLIVQDIVVVLVLIALSAFGDPNTESPFAVELALVLVKGIAFLAAVLLLMRYVLPRLLDQLARSPEMLLLFAISWAIVLAAVSDVLDFSKEIGAFVAGVSLASTAYRETIASRLVTLRDFLLLFFFIDLGARLDLALLGSQLGRSAVFSLFVLVGNPFIVMVIIGLMGYRKRTGFLAGLTVAQISEFSLILGAMALSLGHIDLETMGLITLTGLVTIGLSTYMIIYSAPLFRLLSPALSIFERKRPYREMDSLDKDLMGHVEAIIFGLGTYGSHIVNNLKERGKTVIGVDFDPQAVADWRERGLPALFGDAQDPEFLEHLPLDRARLVVSTAPDPETSVVLLKALRQRGFAGKIVLTARKQDDISILEDAGADAVFSPFEDAAEQATDWLTGAMRSVSESQLWPLSVEEVRLKAGSAFSGRAIGEIPLRAETGVSIIAVSRAGKNFFDPDQDFRIFPGDILVLLGEYKDLHAAADYLGQQEVGRESEAFAVASLHVEADSPWIGHSLHDLDFRKNYGVTVASINRDNKYLMAPGAAERLEAGDRLLVLGDQKSIEKIVRSGGAGRGHLQE